MLLLACIIIMRYTTRQVNMRSKADRSSWV